jgi:hypothetical protein
MQVEDFRCDTLAKARHLCEQYFSGEHVTSVDEEDLAEEKAHMLASLSDGDLRMGAFENCRKKLGRVVVVVVVVVVLVLLPFFFDGERALDWGWGGSIVCGAALSV